MCFLVTYSRHTRRLCSLKEVRICSKSSRSLLPNRSVIWFTLWNCVYQFWAISLHNHYSQPMSLRWKDCIHSCSVVVSCLLSVLWTISMIKSHTCRELSLSKPQLWRWKIVCVYIYINNYRKLNNSLCLHFIFLLNLRASNIKRKRSPFVVWLLWTCFPFV